MQAEASLAETRSGAQSEHSEEEVSFDEKLKSLRETTTAFYSTANCFDDGLILPTQTRQVCIYPST